jgi:hypothetical protein
LWLVEQARPVRVQRVDITAVDQPVEVMEMKVLVEAPATFAYRTVQKSSLPVVAVVTVVGPEHLVVSVVD